MANKKLTIAEKKAQLEEQIKELEVLGDVETIINDLINQYEERVKSELTETYEDGLEPEQDTTREGKLKWKVSKEVAKVMNPERDWRTVYTEEQILEKFASLEEAGAEPYYATHYSTRPITFEEADEWTKQNVRKYRKVVELLKGIEIA